MTALPRTGYTSGSGCPSSRCVWFLSASTWQRTLLSDCCRDSEEGKCRKHTMAEGGRRQARALRGALAREQWKRWEGRKGS